MRKKREIIKYLLFLFVLLTTLFSQDSQDFIVDSSYETFGINPWYYEKEIDSVKFVFKYKFYTTEIPLGQTIFIYYNLTCSYNNQQTFNKISDSGSEYSSNYRNFFSVVISNIPLKSDNCSFKINVILKDENGNIVGQKQDNISFSPLNQTIIINKQPGEGWNVNFYFSCANENDRGEKICDLNIPLNREEGELFSTKNNPLEATFDFTLPLIENEDLELNEREGFIGIGDQKIEYIDWDSLNVNCI